MAINEKPKEQCTHAEPYEGYVVKNRRGRYYKGKNYVWCRCHSCNVIFLGVFWPQTEEEATK